MKEKESDRVEKTKDKLAKKEENVKKKMKTENDRRNELFNSVNRGYTISSGQREDLLNLRTVRISGRKAMGNKKSDTEIKKKKEEKTESEMKKKTEEKYN